MVPECRALGAFKTKIYASGDQSRMPIEQKAAIENAIIMDRECFGKVASDWEYFRKVASDWEGCFGTVNVRKYL